MKYLFTENELDVLVEALHRYTDSMLSSTLTIEQKKTVSDMLVSIVVKASAAKADDES